MSGIGADGVSPWAPPGFAEERELGRGASGRVVAAVHVASGTQVAIKYLSPRLLATPGFLEAFRAEAALLRSLNVPQVVRLFDYAEAPGQGAAIIMELVDGVSLHQMITRQGSTSPESALLVLKGSLLGLAAAHALGIVHRDYKPENVLVDRSGQSKLTDFGVAAPAGGTAAVGGTPLYMAPEQWNGAPATPATDIYAATAVFFECLTGQTPFSGPLGQLAAQHAGAAVPVEMVDEPLRELIARGLAKDPAARPANAVAFVAELESMAARAYGAGWEDRGRGHLAKGAAALLLLLLPHGAAAVAVGTGTATTSTWLYVGIAAAVIGIAAGSVAAVAVSRGHGRAAPVAAASAPAPATAACGTSGAPLAYLTAAGSGTSTVHSVVVRCGTGTPRVLGTFTGDATSLPRSATLAWSSDGSRLGWTTGSAVYVAQATAGAWSVRHWACQGCAGVTFRGGQAVSVSGHATVGSPAVPQLMLFPESGTGQPTTEAVSGIPAPSSGLTSFTLLGSAPKAMPLVAYGQLGASSNGGQVLYRVNATGQAVQYGQDTLDNSTVVGTIVNFAASQPGSQMAFTTYTQAGAYCPTYRADLLDTATGTVTSPKMPAGGGPEGWLAQGMWFDRSGTPYLSILPSVPACGSAGNAPAAGPVPTGAAPVVCKLSGGTWVRVGSGVFQAAYGPGSWQAEITGVTAPDGSSPTTLTISDGPGTVPVTVPSVATFAWAP